jgi:hypothetical protein
LDTVRVGPYTVRLWLFADGDLSPANLGEAFDYYSAVPGWGWRAIVQTRDGAWRARRVIYGASHRGVAYALPEPEAAADSYFPCGREVPLKEGGMAFEGGVPLPPSVQIGIGDKLAVWVAVEDDSGEYRADLRFDLVENESWDALEPSGIAVVASDQRTSSARSWTPTDSRASASEPQERPYSAPERPAFEARLSDETSLVLSYAREEARRLRKVGVASEDLLLGLLRLPLDAAALALSGAGVTLAEARAAVEFFGPTEAPPAGGVDETAPSARKVLLLAGDEAQREGTDSVRPSHVLLGLLRQKGVAVSVLTWLGLEAHDLDGIRRSISKGSAPA